MAQVIIYIKRVHCGTFTLLEAFAGDSVARLAERACTKFPHWRVAADEVELYAITKAGKAPMPAEMDAALLCEPLSPFDSLAEANIATGSCLLARFLSPAPPLTAPSGGGPTTLADLAAALARLELGITSKVESVVLELNQKVELVGKKVELVAYQSTHLLTQASEEKLQHGALFFIQTGQRGGPIFCGFFVSERIALTINHDAMFLEGKTPPTIFGHNSSKPSRELQFELCSTNADLDFSVLKLKAGQPDADAFFLLPSYDSVVGGLHLGLVTMSIGSSAVLEGRPCISQHWVTVTSCDDNFICYDGASTWKGDSGGALLFEEGYVVGLHLEVVDDKPELEVPVLSPAALNCGSSKRGRSAGGALASDHQVLDFAAVSDVLERISVAASSSAKLGRALLLSHPAVKKAVALALSAGTAAAAAAGEEV
jgi:hypothetical protein